MSNSREAVGLLGDDDRNSDPLQGVELSTLKRKPRGALKDDGGRRGTRCGGCGQPMDNYTEMTCPGCDSPMHETCGALVGDDDASPFRLCASCESGHLYQGKQRKKRTSLVDASAPLSIGLTRRRSPSIEAAEKASRGSNIVSTLMSQPQSPEERERLVQRRLSKPPPKDEVPVKIGLLGSDHSVFLAVVLVIVLFVFLVVRASTGGFDSKPSNPNPNKTAVLVEPSDLQAPYQDAWWLSKTSDDFLGRIYVDRQLKAELTNLRDVKVMIEDAFSPMCGKHRFETSVMPKVSIVVGPVYAGYPKGLLSMTVHSVLARTPPEIIQEIVVIHGRLSEEGTKDDALEWELQQLEHLSPLVKVIAVADMSGPVPARIVAIERQTTGDIIVVMDPYVEVWSGTWLQNLILPIMKYPRTIAVPLLHAMKIDQSLKEIADPDSYYMSMNKQFQIEKIKAAFVGSNKEAPSTWEPHKTPFFEGPLFAIHRDQYFKLREMDKGFERFGGSNIELSLKYWMCRGRVIQVPCARAGYISITEWPLPTIPDKLKRLAGITQPGDFLYYGAKADPHTIFSVRNYLRIVRVWFRNHAAKHLFYKEAFGSTILPPEWAQYEAEMEDDDDGIDTEEAGREKNNCQDFEWFDKHVLMSIVGTHHPWYVRKDAKPHS